MSRRELKALCESQHSPLRESRLRSAAMESQYDNEKEQLEALVAELKERVGVFQEKESRLRSAAAMESQHNNEKEQLEALVAGLREEREELTEVFEEKESQFLKELEEYKVTAELERLRVVDRLREEHHEALKREQAQVDLEKEKVKSLHETFATERAAMKVMIENLTLQVQNLKAAALASSDAVVKDTVSAMPNNGLSNNSSNDPPATCGNGSLEPTAGTNGDSPLESSMITATVAQLIKAQTEALAAQTQAVAAQHLPPVKTFTGDGKLTDADSFERWLENFEERAKLVGWNEAQQLHQLKLLLDKTALRAFRMFPKEDRQDFNRAKEALKNRFKSVEIEEFITRCKQLSLLRSSVWSYNRWLTRLSLQHLLKTLIECSKAGSFKHCTCNGRGSWKPLNQLKVSKSCMTELASWNSTKSNIPLLLLPGERRNILNIAGDTGHLVMVLELSLTKRIVQAMHTIKREFASFVNNLVISLIIVHTEANMARKLQVVASTPLNLRTLDRTTMALLSRTEVKEM